MSAKKIVAICMLILAGCSSDEPDKTNEFAEYLDRFAAEAKLRNVAVDVSNINVFFVDETTPAGFCGYTLNATNIQIKKSCWQNFTDLDKEILIFHELGHAVLGRQHTNSLLSNKDKQSMMDPNAYGYYSGDMNAKRTYYVDELFDSSTPEPSWAKVDKPNFIEFFIDSIKTTSPWVFSKISPAEHIGTITTEAFVSPAHSLLIQSTTATGGGSYWRYDLDPSSIPVGSTVTLTAKVKTAGITSLGAHVEFIAFDTSDGDASHILSKDISGTADFTEYKLIMYYFPEKAKTLSIFFLMAGGSSGKAYLDDVKMTVESK